MARVQMKNQNESHAAVWWHLGEELLERSQSARGSSDSNNGKVFLFLLKSRSRSSDPGRFPGFFCADRGMFFLCSYHIGSLCISSNTVIDQWFVRETFGCFCHLSRWAKLMLRRSPRYWNGSMNRWKTVLIFGRLPHDS